MRPLPAVSLEYFGSTAEGYTAGPAGTAGAAAGAAGGAASFFGLAAASFGAAGAAAGVAVVAPTRQNPTPQLAIIILPGVSTLGLPGPRQPENPHPSAAAAGDNGA